MPEVTLYTTMFCGYCARAKRLLSAKNVAFNEIDVSMDPVGRREMEQRSNGGGTVPQIFIGDAHIGGSDELAALERAGKLDALLAGASP